MRSACWVFGLLLVSLGMTQAQPLPDRATLAKIPLNEAMVLDPAGSWERQHLLGVEGFTLITGVDQEAGHPRFAVAEARKAPQWSRPLAVPVDALRYPVVIVTYRATGILPDNGSALSLGRPKQNLLTLLRNGELVADGQVQEAVIDLRDEVQEGAGVFNGVFVTPACRGPEPAAFELLGLRFESDQQLPPLPRTEEEEITVQALDQTGKPVADATVIADPDWLNTARTATTNAEGKATLRVADTYQASHSLRLTKPGMAITEIVTDKAGRLSPTAVLYPGTRYGGVIRDEAGKPIPNVAVTVDAVLMGSDSRNEWWCSAVLTDADGRWRTPVLPTTQRISFRLEHPDYATREPDLGASLAELRDQRGELVLHRGGKLTVHVVDPDGKPVPGAQLRLSRQWNEMAEATAETNAAGAATFPDWLTGQYNITLQAPGFALHQIGVEVKPNLPTVEIRLDPGGVIRGQIVDLAGNPLPGVRVHAERWRTFWGKLWDATTDAEGHFVWREAPLRGVVSFSIGKRGYLSLYSYPLAAGEEEQTIVLPPPLVISGRITDAETGQPIANATVVPGVVENVNPLAEFPPSWRDDMKQKAEKGNYRVTFDDRSGLSSAVLRAEAEGYAGMSSRTIQFDEQGAVCDFQLRRQTPIEAIVRLPDGQPAAGARVFVLLRGQHLMIANALEAETSDPGQAPAVVCRPDGRCRLSGLQRGGLIVALHPKGYLEVSPANWKDSPCLQLQAWGRIEGQFGLGPDPIANSAVRYLPADTSWPPGGSQIYHNLQATTDEQGHFVLPLVPPGKGQLSSTHRLPPPSNRTVTRTVPFDLPPGGNLTVDLVVDAGRRVVGRIEPPRRDGRPLTWGSSHGALTTTVRPDLPEPTRPGFGGNLGSAETQQRVQVWLQTPEGEAYITALKRYYKARTEALATIRQTNYTFPLDADGAFRIDNVQAGDYDLHVFLYSEKQIRYEAPPIGKAKLIVAVPETPAQEPLDLGTVQAEATE